MKDYLGKELNVGDIVVTTSLKYEEFQIARVIKITAKMLQVEILKSSNFLNRPGTIRRKFGHQTIKIDYVPEEDLV